MQLSLRVMEKLRDEIKREGSRVRVIEKITSYPDGKKQEPFSFPKTSEPTTKSTPLTCNYMSSGPIHVAYTRITLPNTSFEGKRSFGFKPGSRRKRIVTPQQNVEITSIEHPELNRRFLSKESYPINHRLPSHTLFTINDRNQIFDPGGK